jgi:hypothetical protein
MNNEELIAKAEGLGADAGKAAGSWYFDGNSSEDAMRAFLVGIEEGDPAVMDTLPSAPLSGEWADDLTPHSLFVELAGMEYDNTLTDALCDELCSAYELAYMTAAENEAVRYARAVLDGLKCPECGEDVWDKPSGSKLAKCWNAEGHELKGTLAFDTME